MPYLSSINPSSGQDRYEGVEILALFSDLRLELDARRLCAYDESDPLYLAINSLEALLRERLSDEEYAYPESETHEEGE